MSAAPSHPLPDAAAAAAGSAARPPELAAAAAASGEPWPVVVAAIAAASALMVAITGYSFLAGNHENYLLDPLRRAGLATFEGDAFVVGTLQYHGLFSLIAAALFKLRVAETGFFLIFAGLVVTLAWAWWRACRALGGGVGAYLASVVAYHLLVADRALGFYSLLQDGQFNAGNVAAVALVVGLAMRLEGRLLWAGLAFGVAGAFHLNYAVVCPALWVALELVRARQHRDALGLSRRASDPELPLRRPEKRAQLRVLLDRSSLLASSLALVPALANVGFALPAKLATSGGERMPMAEFVALYVKLRHPHHYDPSAWPWWLWAAFLLPAPLAVWAWRRHRREPAWNVAAIAWLCLMGLQLFALLTAGVWYVGETFVQLSLWRFGPHAKLLAVTAVVVALLPRLRPRAMLVVTAGLAMLIVGVRGSLAPPGQKPPDAAIVAAATWARENTPVDAKFLVPPGVGSAFPLHARRAHVVSFKLVPQLSGELGGWAERLREVTGVEDLSTFAGGLRGYAVAQERMDAAYAKRRVDDLAQVARREGATHLVRMGIDGSDDERVVWRGESGVTIYELP